MQENRLLSTPQRVPPVRGLVPLHNVQGASFEPLDLKRWVRLDRIAYSTHKIDLLCYARPPEKLEEFAEAAGELGVRLSLRTNGAFPPGDIARLKDLGFLDVFLCPDSLEGAAAAAWFEACSQAGMPLRVQLQPPFEAGFDPDAAAEKLAAAGAVAVNVAAFDPFDARPPCAGAEAARAAIERMNRLVAALAAREVEANLLGLPFCLVDEANRAHAENEAQFFLDHQQYHKGAYATAVGLYARSPVVVQKAMLSMLALHTVKRSTYADNALLPWLIKHPWLHARIWLWHKLTRHLSFLKRQPTPTDDSLEAYRRAAEQVQTLNQAAYPGECARCRLRRICDGASREFARRFPGIPVVAIPGDDIVSPMHFAAGQPKHYDAIDLERVRADELHEELAREANQIVSSRPPELEVGSEDYSVYGQWTHHMPNANQWFAFTPGEKYSTELASLETPFTLSVTFGGGIAELIGFAFGRHARVMCPMEGHKHRLVFHVNREGRYVLLRDGKPVRPVAFEKYYHAPLWLGSHLNPRIVIWNIDGSIVTQTVQVWHGDPPRQAALADVKYSIVIVSSRFTRRLQAVLRTLAHQEGFDLRQLEVIVCYVPGIDATDDLLDGVEAAYPDLRIVRSPYPEEYIHSKGFLINESADRATGEWVVLLDSDVLLPPNWFAKMDEAAGEETFIVPDGRKMLDPETTGKVLLGELDSWRHWDELLRTSGELRLKEAEGVPVGYCQCVRKACFKNVQYQEFDHFEGADWWFAMEIRRNFKHEKRLSGLPVLHLDHGGSQWYGTAKHR